MKRQRGIFLTTVGIICLLAVMGTGCGEEKVSAAEEEKMKKQMTEKFDINNVPPEHRERVRGFMNQGRPQPSAPANAGAADAAKSAPK